MNVHTSERRQTSKPQPGRKGISGGQYLPLDEADILKLHKTSLRVFSEIGVQVNDREARDLFRRAGAQVDESSGVVRIPAGMVEDLVGTAPATVTLCGRDDSGLLDCELGGSQVHMGTGGTALNVQDPGEVRIRPAQLEDITRMATLVNALENIHFYMLNVYPSDVQDEAIDVNRFGAALARTNKHVMGGVYTIDGIRSVIRMAELIAGSPARLRERPFLSMVTCVISPFKLDEHYSRLTMEVARQGIPVVVPSEPLCGATAPITLAGNILIQNVDSLSGVMLAQLVNPGTPTLYGCISSITDLRELKYLSGAVEMGLMNAASAQLARFYNLPYYATAGMTDSKTNDVQAGYESALTSLLVALAGANFIHDAAGFIEFCMTASYDKLVIDNEIIGMVMRAVEGIRVDDETLAFEEIHKAGPGGHFVSSRHTRRHMRSEHYAPQLSDRMNRDVWEKEGAPDTVARATQTVKSILDRKPAPVIPESLHDVLLREIPGLKPQVFR